MEIETRSERLCFEGRMGFCTHHSAATSTGMRFAVFTPPQALSGARCPALHYLAGLECNDQTFVIKAGAQRMAAKLGLLLVASDTSPRGAGIPGEEPTGMSVPERVSTWMPRPSPGLATTGWRAM
jgi:S-formylglutathione hydrolase